MKDTEKLKMLEELEKIPQFIIWRDEVVKPMIDSLEADIANADNMSEVVLRSKLKHIQSVKYMFYTLFEQIKIQKKLEKENNEK